MCKLFCKLFGHWWTYGHDPDDKEIQYLKDAGIRGWGDFYWTKCCICGKLEGHSYN